MTTLVVGVRLTPAPRRALVAVLQEATGAARGACGNAVAALLDADGLVTAALVDLHQRAAALLAGDRGPNRCPRCLEARPMANRDRCRACATERQRQRIEAMERTHERLAVREREVPTDAPAPAEPGPQPAAILDRFELEDVIAMCSRKKAYPSQVDAERVAARCFRERGARLRVYACPACCRYHLTKQLAAPATRAA